MKPLSLWSGARYAIVILALCILCLGLFGEVFHYLRPKSRVVLRDSSAGDINAFSFSNTHQELSRRLPDVICIGSKKGGTTKLIEFLSSHPKITTAPEELHFFDREFVYLQGLNLYRDMLPLASPSQVVLEKSPKYFVYESAASRIHHMNSSIKLILIVRDPIRRLISDYSHEKRLPDQLKFPDTSDKSKQVSIQRVEKSYALEQLVFSTDGGLNMSYAPIVASLYDVHLERWLQFFPRNQLLVVDGENFASDPFPTLRKCEEFLGLPHLITHEMVIKDKNTGYFCLASRGCPTSGHSHPEYSEEFLKRLRALYSPHTQRFFDLLGETFDWPSGAEG